jgi:predicted P-loop ATPase
MMKYVTASPHANELNIGRELRGREELHAGTMLRFDTFSGRCMLCRPLPRPEVEAERDFRPRPIEDNDATHLMEWLQAETFTGVERGSVNAAIEAEGRRNSYSSAAEHLLSLPEWDGEERLDRFFVNVCGVDVISAELGDDGEREDLIDYLAALGRCLFIGIVARIMQPGCKVDTIVVLEGEQGSGKSSLARLMALNDEWFSDSLPADLSSKDAHAHLLGKLIVEFPEIGQMRRSTIEATKAFMSACDDKFRPSYGRNEVTHKRQCVFIGTTNETTYLKDETGNRRFWPVRCGRIDLDKARAIMPELYAEALHYYQTGEKWWLPDGLRSVVERQQRERVADDVWTAPVTEYVREAQDMAFRLGETETLIGIADVLSEALKIERGRQDAAASMRVGVILSKMGAGRRQATIKGARHWVRYLPALPQDGNGARREHE